MKEKWWHQAVGYEVYLRSFQDSNADGIGDFQGIIRRIPYLKALGINAVWITPFYPSPLDDMGYDISDYCAIAPEFGTMSDFEQLVQIAHDAGIRVIIDMVLNHTSDEHPWFQESNSDRTNPKSDWYCWQDGVNGNPPNNWVSAFEGSAWEFCESRQQYYLHQFSKKQPDLNWRNPQVVEAMFGMLRFWLDKGVDGLRFDVFNAMFEAEDLRDNYFIATGTPVDYDQTPDAIVFDPAIVCDNTRNQPETFEMVRRICNEVIEPYGDILTIGECWPCTPAVANEVVGNGALSVAFHFDYHLLNRMDPVPFKAVMQKWEESLQWRREGSWNCYYLSNHDMPRQIDRFGSREKWVVSAKMLATFLLTAPGMVFLYQGEEIGMTNVSFDSINEYRDIQCINEYKHLIEMGRSHDEAFLQAQRMSRDNARTPMQWDNSSHGGFTSGTPWITENENHKVINVEDQLDWDGSILRSYRRLIALRKEHTTLMFGQHRQLLPEHPQLSATLREDDNGTYLVLLNLTAQETQWPELGISLENAELLYANVPYSKSGIPGCAGFILRVTC